MVKLQEKRSVKVYPGLLKKEYLNDLVKTKIQQTIKDLYKKQPIKFISYKTLCNPAISKNGCLLYPSLCTKIRI